MPRGPKPRTTKNAAPRPPRLVPIGKLEPTSALAKNALVEFRRLVSILESRGTLDRVDLAVLTECSRVTGLLNKLHERAAAEQELEIPLDLSGKTIQLISQLTSQRRGLLREMGLTLQPSRSVVKTIAKDSSQAAGESPVAKYLKLKA